jgi:type VI protein secretion system component Hcp
MDTPTGSTSRRTLLLTGATGVGAFGALAPTAAEARLGDPQLPVGPDGDFFLKLTGIRGSSQRDGHEDEIEPLTFAFGGGEAEAAKGGRRVVEWDRFLFAAYSGIHSAPLLQHLVTGAVINSAVLAARRTVDGETSDFAHLELSGCTVASFRSTAHPDDGFPLDVVELRVHSAPTWTVDPG